MATAFVAGLRQRSSPANVDEKNPTAAATTTTESDKDEKMEHPGGSAHHPLLQAGRIIALYSYFLGSCIRYGVLLTLLPCSLLIFTSMNMTQFLGAPMYLYDKDWYYAWMAVTKQHFGLLVVTMQQWWSPTTVRVSGDESIRGQLHQASDGRLECDFPERMVVIANHEVATCGFMEDLDQS